MSETATSSETTPVPKEPIVRTHRRFVISFQAGADSRRALASLLHSIREQVLEGGTNSVFGGPEFGGSWRLIEDESVTHDSYMEAIAAGLDG